MATDTVSSLSVGALYRYPVKSMLGQRVDQTGMDAGGVLGDRRYALLDEATGHVASAKQARWWRMLLQCTATAADGTVLMRLPDGTRLSVDDADVDDALSAFVGRRVRLAHERAAGATLERADPDQVLERGLDAEVDAPLLELAEATPGSSFTDFAPVHAVTTATLAQVGAEAVRYRPNVVIDTPTDHPPYAENAWTGRLVHIGEVTLRAMGPTPRCVIPTLEHGDLPAARHALRTPAAQNRVRSFDFGELPCVGTYLEVVSAGEVRVGDAVTLG